MCLQNTFFGGKPKRKKKKITSLSDAHALKQDSVPEYLNLILQVFYDLNKTSKVAIKTPCGITNQIEMNENVTQGGVWGPLE